MQRPCRICVVPEYPLGLMPGGVQVQAVETFRALSLLPGLDVRLFEWSATEPPADLYHFIGFPRHLAPVANLVRRAGKPYVCTLLTGAGNDTVRRRLAALRQRARRFLGRGRGTEHSEAVREAAALVAITARNRRTISAVYGLSPAKIRVIPNGVAPRFLSADPGAWQSAYGDRPFVLCAGAVQRRKDQLQLAQACNALNLPLVLLGPVLPGEEAYASKVADAMSANGAIGGSWLKNLQSDDPLLPSAYAACRLFALLSRNETQPLSVLEAMAAQKPILLAEAGYNREPPFDSLPAASLESPESLKQSLAAAWKSGQATKLPGEFTWESVARRLRDLYLEILRPAQAASSRPLGQPTRDRPPAQRPS